MGNIKSVLKTVYNDLIQTSGEFEIDEFHEVREYLEESLISLLPHPYFDIARTSFAGDGFGCHAWHVDGRSLDPGPKGNHPIYKNSFHLISGYPGPLTQFYLDDMDIEWVQDNLDFRDCDARTDLPFKGADSNKIGTIGKLGDVLAINGRHIHRTHPQHKGLKVFARISCAPLPGAPGIF